jgi:RNA polymerase I-specific transcription initiation factor RRN7
MKFRRPVSDEEIEEERLDIKRPGEEYRSYKSEEELPETARPFFLAAAEVACTSLKNLMLAVLQTEAKITRWKNAQRRAEVTGEDVDLEAERGTARDKKDETGIRLDMEAMHLQSSVEQETGIGEESEVDMEMIS